MALAASRGWKLVFGHDQPSWIAWLILAVTGVGLLVFFRWLMQILLHELPRATAARAAADEAARESERNLRFLAAAGSLLGRSLDYKETLADLARFTTEDLADWCFIHIREDSGALSMIAAAHRDPAKQQLIRELERDHPYDPSLSIGPGEVIRTGQPLLVPQVSDSVLRAAAASNEQFEVIAELGFRSGLIVPLSSGDERFGALTLARSENPVPFDAEDGALVEEIGRRAGTAVANAKIYGERDHIARTLQRSLLPPHLPHLPEIELASRFLPLGRGNEVGGDFYDCFKLGSERWLVALGDVCGKGPEAAAVAALTRYTIHAAALEHRLPSEMLHLVDDVLRRQPSARFATVALAIIDLSGRTPRLQLALGGHPPPLLLRADGELVEIGTPGTMLGVLDEFHATDTELELGPGERLLLYTDGLVEARAGSDLFGISGVERVLRQSWQAGGEQIAALLEQEALGFCNGTPQDDMALVVLEALALIDEAEGEATAEQCHLMRHQLAARCIDAGISERQSQTVELLAAEMLSNAVRHGSGKQMSFRLLRGEGRVRVEVYSEGPEFNAEPREAKASATSGRGLAIIDAMATEWGISSHEGSQRAWFELLI